MTLAVVKGNVLWYFRVSYTRKQQMKISFPPTSAFQTAALTFIAVVLASTAAPRHLARVGGAVRVSTSPSWALVETLLALPVALAVLAIRALSRGTGGLVPQAGGSEVSSEGTRERRLPPPRGEFLFGGLGRGRGSIATAAATAAATAGPIVLVVWTIGAWNWSLSSAGGEASWLVARWPCSSIRATIVVVCWETFKRSVTGRWFLVRTRKQHW